MYTMICISSDQLLPFHSSLNRLGDVNLQLCYSDIIKDSRAIEPHCNGKSISVSCLLQIQISPTKIWKVWIIAASASGRTSLSTPQNFLCEPAIFTRITRITSITVVKTAKFTWCSITRNSGTWTIAFIILIGDSSGISPQEVLTTRITMIRECDSVNPYPTSTKGMRTAKLVSLHIQ